METEEMMELFTTPEAAAFAAAVLAVLLGLAIIVIGGVAVMLICHTWWTFKTNERKER